MDPIRSGRRDPRGRRPHRLHFLPALSVCADAANSPPPLNPDYYVTPKKLYPYDLKSAQQLTRQPVWVKVGYSIAYFPYDRAKKRAGFAHPAGLLLPMEKLQIQDVVLGSSPDAPGVRQVLALFEKDGQTYAFSVGSATGDDYRILSDDMLFIQDPHELYKHWPADVWEAIDRHQMKPGMNELQAALALGLGIPDKSTDPLNRSVNYPNGGNPLMVTYREGRAVDVGPGSAP